MKLSRSSIALALVSSFVAACSGSTPENVTSPPPPPAATGIVVNVGPGSASLDACKQVTFTASVTGTTNQGVNWAVREGAAGGSIAASGEYTAPSTPGTYHVVAASVADPSKTAEGAVTVGPEKVLSVQVTPGNPTALANGTVAFNATVTTSCGSFAAQ